MGESCVFACQSFFELDDLAQIVLPSAAPRQTWEGCWPCDGDTSHLARNLPGRGEAKVSKHIA